MPFIQVLASWGGMGRRKAQRLAGALGVPLLLGASPTGCHTRADDEPASCDDACDTETDDEPASCEEACGDSECAAPGACSHSALCDLVGCGTALVDDVGCLRPECTSDDGCAANERCTLLLWMHRSNCRQSGDSCECDNGKGLFDSNRCSPVPLVGQRGVWKTLKVTEAAPDAQSEWTVAADGSLEIVVTKAGAILSESAETALETTDLGDIVDMVAGPALRSSLVDGSLCTEGNGEDEVVVRLSLDTGVLEKSVSTCVSGASSQAPFPQLLAMLRRY